MCQYTRIISYYKSIHRIPYIFIKIHKTPRYIFCMYDTISREEALKLIHSDKTSSNTFNTFQPEYQKKLIAFLQGNRGLEIVYNNFFLYVMNVEQHPDRIEDFLSCILQTKVKIRQILPREGNMLSDKGSLVIMDIIVELEEEKKSVAEMEAEIADKDAEIARLKKHYLQKMTK